MTTGLEAFTAVFRAASAAADVESLPGYAMEALVAAVPSDRAELVWGEAGEPRLAYVRGVAGAGVGSPVPGDSAWLHTLTARSARPVTLPDPAAASRPPRLRQPYAAAVPLVARGMVVGTLLLARSSGSYDSGTVECLAAVGCHLGTALEHARLMASVIERTSSDAAAIGRRSRGARSRTLTALGEVAAGVAHDLNNALHPVITFLELAKEGADDPELVRAYAAKALLAARDGAEIVRRIQRFTRREAPTVEQVELAGLVQEVLELTRAVWAERTEGGSIDVVQEVEPGLTLAVNPGELRQALVNLVSNAVDSMPEGGMLRLVGRSDAGRVLLAVQDTGGGMSAEVLRRAPEPFFTTKGMRGTGLGLSEVFGVVRRHAGTVELESWQGVGTTVMLRLPAEEAAARPSPSPHPARRRRTEPARILLVDDNVLVLEAAAVGLRAAGHEVVTAASGTAALQAFEPGCFDLVLTDIGMSDLCGWELLDRLREEDGAVRLGVITGWPVAENDPELVDRTLDVIIQKPIDPDTLVRLVEELPG